MEWSLQEHTYDLEESNWSQFSNYIDKVGLYSGVE